jgi:hypothetical protein
MNAVRVVMEARASGLQLGVDDDLVLEASAPPPTAVIDMLRAHKPEILELLRAERRTVIKYIADHPPGRCIHCGGDGRADDPFVVIFCGSYRAELHAGCHPAWVELRESVARAALGIDPPDCERRRPPEAQGLDNVSLCFFGATRRFSLFREHLSMQFR